MEARVLIVSGCWSNLGVVSSLSESGQSRVSDCYYKDERLDMRARGLSRMVVASQSHTALTFRSVKSSVRLSHR